MICVLRIGATDGEQVQELAPAAPYRKDLKGHSSSNLDVLYYDIIDSNDKSDFVKEIASFLKRNRKGLLNFATDSNVKWVNLDIGLLLSEAAFSTSLEMSSDIITMMSESKISLSISAYKAS